MKRIGYGQVEPNHLSAQRNGKIYAQLPADPALKLIENGMFLKYDYAANEVNTDGEGEWLLVYNEVKTYDARETYKDFALKAENAHNGVLVPRLLKTDIGDIYTTNCIGKEADEAAAPAVGTYLVVGADGYLVSGAKGEGMAWKVVDNKIGMPDGQAGVKIQRVQ
jgi:hypothetical protein